MEPRYRLVISCPDRVGIVAMVSNFISSHGGSISEASQHLDSSSGWFFMRYEISSRNLAYSIEELRDSFRPLADSFTMNWRLTDASQPKRVMLMASKQAHCLSDLLYRYHNQELDCEIPCVVSNHDDLRRMVDWHGIPYHHVPVDKSDKQAAFDQVVALAEQYQVDTIVLARYMQILPPELCESYAGRVINIHHSFLPSFAGAKPYHQAHERGVKLIGATCHYVTEELDAGPIIDQDVIRITHNDSAEDMVRLGSDVERQVLSRGLRWHLEDRVLVHGNKTVIFA